MAVIYQFPIFSPLLPRKLIISSPPYVPNLCINNDSHKCRCVIVRGSLKKKSSRKVKSNAELCNDIREFLSAVGLPESHVPTMKELSLHGRQDLAHIVRRRGYKLIKELLESSSTEGPLVSDIDSDQTTEVDVLGGCESQNEQVDVVPDNILSNGAIQEQEEIFNAIETDDDLRKSDPASFASQTNTLSLHEKAARFVQHGELDEIEDGSIEFMNPSDGEGTGQNYISEDSPEPKFSQLRKTQSDLAPSSSSGAETLNGPYSLSSQNFEASVPGNGISRSNDLLTEESTSYGKDSDDERNENETEVQRLKFLLHQKEMELVQLKQQIEKETLLLSKLQSKAEAEISKAQKLISEKEMELRAAEECLSGLIEVEIEYTGDGDTVELAGSFNGWHHKIKMDPQPLMDLAESRSARVWQAVLWLYPGVYEVKFVVDGRWTIDPQRESITRDGVHNNIIRVVR